MKRQLQIESMTEEGRSQLQAQFDLWKSMPEADREQYRLFHEELKSNAELREAFESYYDWLTSVPRPERDELRAARNATERIVKMQSLVERQTQAGQHSTKAAYPKFGDPNVLTREDFKGAMQAVEVVLKAELPEMVRHLQNFRAKDELKKYRNLLARLLHELANSKPAATNAMDAAMTAVTEPKTLQKLKQVKPIENQRIRMYYLLVRSLAAEITERSPDLSTDRGKRVLDETFLRLDPKLQDELTRFPPDAFWGQVMTQYSESQDLADIPPAMQMVISANVENLPSQFRQIGKWVPRPDRPRGGNLKGDR